MLPLRCILHGAWDRHNFGDLLIGRIATEMLGPPPPAVAGLASRQMARHGGLRVRPLQTCLAAAAKGQPPTILHPGGEILTCSAWEAAVMLLPPGRAAPTIAHLEQHPAEREAWVRRCLGTAARAPYLAPREWLPPGTTVIVHAAGGMDLDRRDPALRDEVIGRLREAEDVTVRDRRTLHHLRHAGLDAGLVPDPAALTAHCFADRIRRHAAAGEPARLRAACPGGWLAVQFSAEFADDQTLAMLAAQLDAAAAELHCGIALFRAGAAPWHDDLGVLRRAAARLRTRPVFVCRSLHLWDICAVVAGARAYAGSSLHGRIVALAHAVPRVGLHPRGRDPRDAKQQAYAETWEPPPMARTVAPHDLAGPLLDACRVDPSLLRGAAARHAAHATAAFERLRRRLSRPGMPPCAPPAFPPMKSS